MSSNKTIIPGMEDAYTEHSGDFGNPTKSVQDGTCVPNPFGIQAPINKSNQKPIL